MTNTDLVVVLPGITGSTVGRDVGRCLLPSIRCSAGKLGSMADHDGRVPAERIDSVRETSRRSGR